MDGVLRGSRGFLKLLKELSFNPCSNGWCTSSAFGLNVSGLFFGFNPCSNGWCTSSVIEHTGMDRKKMFQSLF